MNIETIAIADLSPDPANVREHTQRNIDAIKASLRRFGQQKPIVVDSHNIVRAGNGTLAAALALGWTEVRIIRTHLDGADAIAYAIADNRTQDLSSFDNDALGRQLASLRDEGIAMTDIGFTDKDVDKLLGELPMAEAGGDEQWMVIVTCRDEADQAAFLDQMQAENRVCRALLG